ncbi:hypothetical protein E2C01_056781 [Portunus trituberculatus]|uniref:Uncharacterized protein n=1 Tax=Portunus trituberculatus TaxID=210409 RepID=A0A5B7GV34_PORTR|nr:hypothetical protein [Portunus trituberculatus]
MRSLFEHKAILPDKPMTHLSPARNLYISDKTYLAYKPVSEAKYSGDRLTYLQQAKKEKNQEGFEKSNVLQRVVGAKQGRHWLRPSCQGPACEPRKGQVAS